MYNHVQKTVKLNSFKISYYFYSDKGNHIRIIVYFDTTQASLFSLQNRPEHCSMTSNNARKKETIY